MEMQSTLKQMAEMLASNITDEMTKMSLNKSGMKNEFQSVMSKQCQMNSSSSDTKKINDKNNPSAVGQLQNAGNLRKEQLQNSDMAKDYKLSAVKEDASIDDLPEEVVEVVASWMTQIKEQICQQLDLSEDELDTIMDELGMQMTDLQLQTNVQQLVLTVAGEDDNLALLTNEDLSDQVTSIMKLQGDFTMQACEELEIPQEAFLNAVNIVETTDEMSKQKEISPQGFGAENLETSFLTNEAMETSGQMTTENLNKVDDSLENSQQFQADMPTTQVDMKTPEQTVQTENVVQIKEDNFEVPVVEKNVTSNMQQNLAQVQDEQENMPGVFMEQQLTEEMNKVALEETNKKEVGLEIVSEEVKTPTSIPETKDTAEEMSKDNLNLDAKVVSATEKETETSEMSSGDNSESKKDGKQEQTPVMEQLLNHIVDAKVEQTVTVEDKVQVAQQFHEIVDQVVEQIKVTVTEDTSEMAIQLNPENLGKVNLSVVARDGHITAQFVAENEIARQALEGQIQQLRDTLGDQGLKVDKVEVSVSDFSFQQGNQTNSEEQKEKQRNFWAKQVHKNINLADITDNTDMTEEERLAVNIMRDNGNQVDFTA